MGNNKEQISELFAVAVKMRNLMLKFRPSESISAGEMHMLRAIEHCVKKNKASDGQSAGVTSSELSRQLKASKPSTSRMLSFLEEKNYIKRVSKSRDRRVVYINLTPEGQEVLKKAANKMDELLDSIASEMGEDELKQFVSSFHKLYDIMNKSLR